MSSAASRASRSTTGPSSLPRSGAACAPSTSRPARGSRRGFLAGAATCPTAPTSFFIPTQPSTPLTWLTSSSINLPRARRGGNSILPKRVRMRRDTVRPCVSNILRTSRLRPSLIVTWYHWFTPSPPRLSMVSKRAGMLGSSDSSSASILTPVSKFCVCSSVSSPKIRTAYSRSTS